LARPRSSARAANREARDSRGGASSFRRRVLRGDAGSPEPQRARVRPSRPSLRESSGLSARRSRRGCDRNPASARSGCRPCRAGGRAGGSTAVRGAWYKGRMPGMKRGWKMEDRGGSAENPYSSNSFGAPSRLAATRSGARLLRKQRHAPLRVAAKQAGFILHLRSSCLIFAVVLVSATCVRAGWLDPQWQYRRAIDVAWSADAAEGGELAVAEFNSDGHCAADGPDVRVALEQGHVVPSHVLMSGPGDRIRVVFQLEKGQKRYYAYF